MKIINSSLNTTQILRAGMDNLKEVILLVLDKEFNYIYFNNSHKNTMKKIYGVDVEIGNCVFDYLLVKEDLELQKHHYQLALEGTPTSNIGKYGINNDRFFETYYDPIYVDGEIVGLTVVSVDISLKVRKRYMKSDTDEKIRRVYSSMPQAFSLVKLIYDESGKPIDFEFVEVNNSYETLFNRKSEDIIGRTVREISATVSDDWITKLGRVAKTGVSSYFEEYTKVIDKYLSTYAYSPEKDYVASLTIDVNDDFNFKKPTNPHSFQIGDLTYNIMSNTLSHDGNYIELNATEAKFFYILCDYQNEIVSYDKISESMEFDSLMEIKDVAKVYIHRLRRKLAIIGCSKISINSHYGKGYSLVLEDSKNE